MGLILPTARAGFGGQFPRPRAATLNDAIVPNGLVGWWTMDVEDVNFASGTTIDRSQAGIVSSNGNATLNGLPASKLSQGQINQSLLFDGSTSWINVGGSLTIPPAYQGLSACCWFNATSIAAGVQGTFSKYDSVGSQLFYIGTFNSNSFRGLIVTTGGSVGLSSTATISAGFWYFGVMTWSAITNTIVLYLNGAPTGTAATTGTLSSSSAITSIGSRLTSGSAAAFFPGYIDDVRLYNRTLDQNEINQIYQAGLAGLAYWPANGARLMAMKSPVMNVPDFIGTPIIRPNFRGPGW